MGNRQTVIKELLSSMGERKRPTRKVFLINGAPGSGKTTYVQSRRQPGDLVLDLDYICSALNASDDLYGDHRLLLDTALSVRDLLLDEIKNRRGKWENAYVITSNPKRGEVLKQAEQMHAELIIMQTNLEDCLDNLRGDVRRSNSVEKYEQLAKKWYAAQHK